MEKTDSEVVIYLYDAKGSDQEINLEAANPAKLHDKQLLWVNILKRSRETVERVVSALNIEDAPVKSILDVSERPKIDKFENFYRFFIVSVNLSEDGKSDRMPIDFLVGKNYVVTVHDGEVDYFHEFRKREKGETQIGELDAESFVATLLDLHIVSYFRALENLEQKVDRLDEKILRRDLEEQEFLSEVVSLRRTASKLRRWFLPHRDVFYALSRSDFTQISESDSVEHFHRLNHHFESAVDAIEHSRETIISLFELYTTKTAHKMNNAMQRLTFITLTAGALGVIAGIFGMNFEVSYFKAGETGFWMTLGGMLFLAIAFSVIAKFKGWL
jgi:magnesium/cobalt transport protein CorA